MLRIKQILALSCTVCSSFAFASPDASAAVVVPSNSTSIAGVSGEVFGWDQDDTNSTSAFWTDFSTVAFDGAIVDPSPGFIPAGASVVANTTFESVDGPSQLTFNSFANLIPVSNNAYGGPFAPVADESDFFIDAFATVLPGTAGGDFTRIVAQFQTRGAELDYSSLLLSTETATEGTVLPSFRHRDQPRTFGWSWW